MGETIRLQSRQWELTATRYLIGPLFWQRDVLNGVIDPQKSIRVAEQFGITLKPDRTQYTGHLEDFTAVLSTNGGYALYEFTGALPKATSGAPVLKSDGKLTRQVMIKGLAGDKKPRYVCLLETEVLTSF